MKYAVKTQCKEVLAYNNTPMTKDGQWVWVVKCEWGPGSENVYDNEIPADVMLFKTFEKAREFMREWKGHPWWIEPNGNYIVVKVEPIYKKVIIGYKEKQNGT